MSPWRIPWREPISMRSMHSSRPFRRNWRWPELGDALAWGMDAVSVVLFALFVGAIFWLVFEFAKGAIPQ